MHCPHHAAENCECKQIEERRDILLEDFFDAYMNFKAGRHRYKKDYDRDVDKLEEVYYRVKNELMK